MAGNNKSLSHEQITALSPGPLPLLVKEIVGGLLCVIIHISLPFGKKIMPCICLEGCIFHEIFLDLGSMFMLSAAYRIVLKGRRAHWYRRTSPLCGHATSTLQAPTCPSGRKQRTGFPSLAPSLPCSQRPSGCSSQC